MGRYGVHLLGSALLLTEILLVGSSTSLDLIHWITALSSETPFESCQRFSPNYVPTSSNSLEWNTDALNTALQYINRSLTSNASVAYGLQGCCVAVCYDLR